MDLSLHIQCAAASLLTMKRTHTLTPPIMRTGDNLEGVLNITQLGQMNGVYGWGTHSAWSDDDTDCEVSDIQYLSQGGYNLLWLVTTTSMTQEGAAWKFILRIPGNYSMLPDQLLNEVACLQYVALHLPNIRVPKVYAFDAGVTLLGGPFIAEEFITGVRLDQAWDRYTDEEKDTVALKLAEIVVDMGETSFPGIGGLTLQHTLGPTIEGPKFFDGRDQYHSHACYNIGPYNSTKEYVISCYDREIYHYTHAPDSVIDLGLFTQTTLPDFIKILRKTRQSLIDNDSVFDPEEPFVFCHGDFHGQNILVSGTDIAGIVDWEFAGAYPLSELLGDEGVDVVACQSILENSKWRARILRHVRDRVKSQGWSKKRIEWLLDSRNEELQTARSEMVPNDAPERLFAIPQALYDRFPIVRG